MPIDHSKPQSQSEQNNFAGSGRRDGSSRQSSERGLVLRWRVAFLVLCTAGALLAADLIRLHVKVHTDPAYHSYCAISERANCETVAASDYAVLLNLPIAVWGLLGYLLLGTLAIWGLRRPLTPPSWPYGGLFWLSLFSALASTALNGISHFVIESICIVCMGVYAVNLALLGVSTTELIRLKTSPIKGFVADLKAAVARPFGPAAIGLVFGMIVVLLLGVVPAYWRVDQQMGPGELAVGVTEDGHAWIGAKRPVLTITEYSDYQCPYCKRGHEEIRQLLEKYPDKIRLVHRHYPLDQSCNQQLQRPFHPYACSYARLAYCAQQINRFWEANDVLYKKGRRRDQFFAWELAVALKIGKEELEKCENSAEAAAAVERDLGAGHSLNIRGTPTYVIGDQVYPGIIPDQALSGITK
jgi:protein-disulfide isomerase/uncharacterized membrane protein